MLRNDETFTGTELYVMLTRAKFASINQEKPKLNNKVTQAPPPSTNTTSSSANEQTHTEEKKSCERRDKMREMENRIQSIWKEEKTFEVDASDEVEKDKFFCTFPYPYMNGRLHLGHAFTVTKADFMAGYQRLKGKKVLFPFGFHCTGMPISAAAKKLKRELEGDDANQPTQKLDINETTAINTTKIPDGKFTSKKSKTAKKTGTAKSQSEILLMTGIPEEEIPKFKDPAYWLDYFPPLGEQDLRLFGLLCYWRRSFITSFKSLQINFSFSFLK